MWPFDELVPWLRARIAEDRLRADLLAEDYTVAVEPETEEIADAVYEIANQRAVLAMCDAYTAVLDAHDRSGQVRGAQIAVLGVGLAYRHHPGYREEWRSA